MAEDALGEDKMLSTGESRDGSEDDEKFKEATKPLLKMMGTDVFWASSELTRREGGVDDHPKEVLKRLWRPTDKNTDTKAKTR
eukprot:8317538-Pyramimonas_sp.AAC.1